MLFYFMKTNGLKLGDKVRISASGIKRCLYLSDVKINCSEFWEIVDFVEHNGFLCKCQNSLHMYYLSPDELIKPFPKIKVIRK